MTIDLGTGLSVRDVQPVNTDPIPRDKNGWPLVPDPNKAGETLKCHRPSGIAKRFLTDDYNIKLWEQRLVVKGVGLRPDLGQLAAALDIKADKDTLNDYAKQAAVAAGRDAKANTGTALHRQMEAILKGETIQAAPDLAEDIAAIQAALDRYGIKPVTEQWVEPFVINPHVPAAGSPDGYVTSTVFGAGNFVADLKTGETPLDYSAPLEHAVQLAIYANATHSWNGNPHYLPWETPALNTDIGLLIHRSGDGYDITPIDIAEGWQMVQLAMAVRDARRGVKRFILPTPETSDRIIGSVTSISEHLAKRDVPPTLEANCEALAERLRSLVEMGFTTADTVKAEWPGGCPSLKRPQDHTELSVATVDALIGHWESDAGHYPALYEDIKALIARLKLLPQDLQDTATKLAAELPNPVNLMTRKGAIGVMAHQLEGLLGIAQALEGRHGVRCERLLALSASAEFVNACDLIGLQGSDLRPITGNQADQIVALCALWRDKPDDLTAALVAMHGSKSEVLKIAKELAEIHDMAKPRSTKAVAENVVLAALVLAEPAVSATEKVLATFPGSAEE